MKYVSESRVEYVNHMGSDLSVVNAARVSFGKQRETLEDGDKKLISYLATNGHWTPFGHAQLSLRINSPIFVARQLVKHQVGLVWNETSRRYVDDEPEFYLPLTWRGRADSVKQGSGQPVESYAQKLATVSCREVSEFALDSYNDLLARGVAPEQARMLLPLNAMTEWIWSGSLAAFARVCKLRLDAHSQKETQEVAQKIYAILHQQFPVSTDALLKVTTE